MCCNKVFCLLCVSYLSRFSFHTRFKFPVCQNSLSVFVVCFLSVFESHYPHSSVVSLSALALRPTSHPQFECHSPFVSVFRTSVPITEFRLAQTVSQIRLPSHSKERLSDDLGNERYLFGYGMISNGSVFRSCVLLPFSPLVVPLYLIVSLLLCFRESVTLRSYSCSRL